MDRDTDDGVLDGDGDRVVILVGCPCCKIQSSWHRDPNVLQCSVNLVVGMSLIKLYQELLK